MQAIKDGLEQFRIENVKIEREKLELPQVDGVPEELFRRFCITIVRFFLHELLWRAIILDIQKLTHDL